MDVKVAISEFLNTDTFSKPSKDVLSSILLSENVQLSIQLRALYCCRDLPVDDATAMLLSALDIHFDTFLRHEIAYVLGQSGCIGAANRLAELLDDPAEDPMVRHEAAEALAALGTKEFFELIEKYSTDNCKAIRDTCLLALYSIANSDNGHGVNCTLPTSSSPYRAIDPILTAEINDELPLERLADLLFNEGLPLYKRYEFLYAIRGISGDAAAKIIGDALIRDKTSEVFRHECAFVLGQMQSMASVGALIECLNNSNEEPMARHEAALALGSCGMVCSDSNCDAVIIDALTKFAKDPIKVVSDSCIVALDYINESKVVKC